MIASRQRQRGVALLVALLVVALAVILVAALLDRGELALARTRNLLRGEQAEAYAQGLEAYAAEVLQKTWQERLDTNTSPWAMPLPTQPVPGGAIGATMRDQNGCFNLNNLAAAVPQHAQWRGVFGRLLARLGLASELGTAVERWLDSDDAAADTNAYLAQSVPYRPHGGPFAHVSELRLVRGVSGEAYARLAPHVCALPRGTKLNVNTATVPVLWALSVKLSQATAEKLWNGGQARYGGPSEFLAQAGLGDEPELNDLLDVRSTYFLVRSDIVLDAVPFTFYSLIERVQGRDIHVLQRSRGADSALVAAAPIAAGETP